MLLLNSLLGHTVGATNKPSMARQRMMEEERERAVQAYRKLKKQKQEQRDRTAGVEKPKDFSWRSWILKNPRLSEKKTHCSNVWRNWFATGVGPARIVYSEEETHICILRPQCEVSDQAFSCWSWFHLFIKKTTTIFGLFITSRR